jgi:hypothetical protein
MSMALLLNNGTPEPVIILTGFVKILQAPFDGPGYTFYDEGTANQLSEDSDLKSGNSTPTQNNLSRFVFALWDDSPRATRISISITAPNWTELQVMHIPVPTPAG